MRRSTVFVLAQQRFKMEDHNSLLRLSLVMGCISYIYSLNVV